MAIPGVGSGQHSTGIWTLAPRTGSHPPSPIRMLRLRCTSSAPLLAELLVVAYEFCWAATRTPEPVLDSGDILVAQVAIFCSNPSARQKAQARSVARLVSLVVLIGTYGSAHTAEVSAE